MTRVRQRKSRLLAMLVGVAWLPYVTICCVVAPVADAVPPRPHCPLMANAARALPDGVVSQASHASQDTRHASDEGSGPIQTCCDLKIKTRVTPEKSFDLTVPAPAVVVAVTIAPVRPNRTPRAPTNIRVSPHEHDPPIYLANSSFLI